MNYILDRIQRMGYAGRTGHPCAYDALDIAARIVRATSYLEIGVYDGASLFSVLQAVPTVRRLALCDLFGHDWVSWGSGNGGAPAGTHAHIDRILALLQYPGQVQFLVGDSRDLVPVLPRSEQFDLAFVDGDHSHDIALTDATNVWPLLRLGGILVMDDAGRSEVSSAIGILLDRYQMRHLFTLDDGADATAVYEKVGEST